MQGEWSLESLALQWVTWRVIGFLFPIPCLQRQSQPEAKTLLRIPHALQQSSTCARMRRWQKLGKRGMKIIWKAWGHKPIIQVLRPQYLSILKRRFIKIYRHKFSIRKNMLCIQLLAPQEQNYLIINNKGKGGISSLKHQG